MNRSNILHGLVAGCVTLFFALLGLAWLGAGLGIGFYLGREHSQREAKLGGPYKVKPWAGFTGWSRDAVFDFTMPVAASMGVLCAFIFFGN